MTKKMRWLRQCRARYGKKLTETKNYNRRLILYGLILLVNDQLTGRIRKDETLKGVKNESLVSVPETSVEKKSLPSLMRVEQTSLF